MPGLDAQPALLVANGDPYPADNRNGWPAQQRLERALAAAVGPLGQRIVRAHPCKRREGHGFIASQQEGMEVFSRLDREAPLIVALSGWHYSQQILPGLMGRRGPLLTVSNWSGSHSGQVGMLNLNACLAKAGVRHSTLWSEDFADPFFLSGFERWMKSGSLRHPIDHVKPIGRAAVPLRARRIARKIAADLHRRNSILGVFDEGCIGMYNAIVPDELLAKLGIFKERLSQSALYHAVTRVSAAEAREVFAWLGRKGMQFHLGKDDDTELTERQILQQCRTYIAAARIADEFGCEAIGIQYQQGLRDLLPASDLAEGLLNNSDRPPVRNSQERVIRRGRPITHFNEADECAGLDGILTNRVHSALGQPVENTLHDLRWGDRDQSGTTGEFVWVLLISGSAPPAHHVGGFRGTDSVRQPAACFPLGGGTVRGIARPGHIVWSRVFVEDGRLKIDLGRGIVPALPREETERRWRATTLEWPIMHAVTCGVSRDQMMARHKSNHIHVAYARSAREADLAAYTKAALAEELGIEASLCGTKADASEF